MSEHVPCANPACPMPRMGPQPHQARCNACRVWWHRYQTERPEYLCWGGYIRCWCGRRMHARGLCKTHHAAWRRAERRRQLRDAGLAVATVVVGLGPAVGAAWWQWPR